MRNHDQKIKDMSRSVLPSTGRKSARDNRRIIHKQQRARELAALAATGLPPEDPSHAAAIRGLQQAGPRHRHRAG
jgi:hypothetical protein